MATIKTITDARFEVNGVASNTYKDDVFQNELDEYVDDFRARFFGAETSQKVIDFFEITQAKYNAKNATFKGNILKHRLALSYADATSWNFYDQFIGSNRETVTKQTPNSDTDSPARQFANMNKIAKGLDTVERSSRNMIALGKVEIHSTCSVVGDVATFSDPQLLEVGDDLTIGGVAYEAIDETTEGKVYQLAAAPGDASSVKAWYDHEFTSNDFPQGSPFNVTLWPRN